MDAAAILAGKYLYFGNLPKDERQYASGLFIGLALEPLHEREIRHDARDPLPVPDNSVERIQSQDVFEHIPYDALPPILDEIMRVLVPGGRFRLSLPDYNSPFLLSRCVFDEEGRILCDLRMGGSVRFDRKGRGRLVEFAEGGNAHLWFPTYPSLYALIQRSTLRHCRQIQWWQGFQDRTTALVLDIPEYDMWVKRAAPHDRRAGGKPVSLVVDFVK
ncbi:class I SAM-dependent methyltransferase [Sediminicoccus sp. BL-A-41-H5]|uniref:class I SAM-dependent methyltransferase n=1 Tax=Sediminicoccus sp. BL-A-41-H5 TaxID=3421106 RepID=UPI003D676870